MPEVTPYSKEDQLRNAPGARFCPRTGALHSQCDCPASRSRMNRINGLKAQRRDGKQLARGLGRNPGRLNNEETTNWPIRWESKSGAQAKSVWKFYEACKAQSDAATPIGSFYPFVAVADGLAVLAVTDLKNLLNEAKRGTA